MVIDRELNRKVATLMINLFWPFSNRVDYGEQELCAGQSLLQGNEYLEYLSSETSFSKAMNKDAGPELL